MLKDLNCIIQVMVERINEKRNPWGNMMLIVFEYLKGSHVNEGDTVRSNSGRLPNSWTVSMIGCASHEKCPPRFQKSQGGPSASAKGSERRLPEVRWLPKAVSTLRFCEFKAQITGRFSPIRLYDFTQSYLPT